MSFLCFGLAWAGRVAFDIETAPCPWTGYEFRTSIETMSLQSWHILGQGLGGRFFKKPTSWRMSETVRLLYRTKYRT